MPDQSTVQLSCPSCHGEQFEIFVLKDEGVGAVKCVSCDKNYLLLDSADFWFDVIQGRPYPRLSRCSCKVTNHQLTAEYSFGDDCQVRSVNVDSKCGMCGKVRRQLALDIDYAPTNKL